MFERFTDRARRVVVLAQEEARMLNHNHIGTEHILLGLIQEREGVAAEALESLGISLDAARQQVEEAVGRSQEAPSGHIPFTSRAKKVLELSLREALQLGHDYIGTEHILLGLIKEGDGVAARVLVRLGADLNRVRPQVIELIAGRRGEEVAGEGAQQGERARAGLPDDVQAQIASLDRRLAAIERWAGMRPDLADQDQQIAQARREKEAAIDRQDFEVAAAMRDKEKQLLAARAAREREWAEAGAARPSLASEFGQVNSELARLRALLREHGIDPGNDAA
jgi:ATP-dependent Clp protease ATP-binding subunit ClpA